MLRQFSTAMFWVGYWASVQPRHRCRTAEMLRDKVVVENWPEEAGQSTDEVLADWGLKSWPDPCDHALCHYRKGDSSSEKVSGETPTYYSRTRGIDLGYDSSEKDENTMNTARKPVVPYVRRVSGTYTRTPEPSNVVPLRPTQTEEGPAVRLKVRPLLEGRVIRDRGPLATVRWSNGSTSVHRWSELERT